MNKKHTYDLGIVGNCAYLAYINKMASVRWMCLPHFDSSCVFGALLDEEKGGEFSIHPANEILTTKQYYLSNTNVLATEFQCSDGTFRVLDFAPRFELYDRWHKPLMLFRKIEQMTGTPSVVVRCRPTGEYGNKQATPVLGSNHIAYTGIKGDIRLTSNVSKSAVLNETSFALTENKYLVFSYGKSFEAPLKATFEEFLAKTIEYWRKWIERCTIPHFYQEQVIRSGLILKLHQNEDTGAIIASGTTSLPEYPGSGRNWDYRYCWIRDSYFTLSALDSLSQFEEVDKYSHYIQDLVQDGFDTLQPVYAIDGRSNLVETQVQMQGYLGNGPVRVGNDAYTQIQNDVYGQVILSILPLFIDKRIVDSKPCPPIELIHDLLKAIEKRLDEPDAGIWEYRNRTGLHTESLLFHWAGCKGAMKIAREKNHAALLTKAQNLLAEVEKRIEKCFDFNRKVYTVGVGIPHLNASEFLLITMNYLNGNEQKAKEHLAVLENALKTPDHLIYRYRDEDDFGETHATFLICGFWYAEALACVGRVDNACQVFQRLVECANHLGIFSEDICPKDGSQWGNFGQTYSHVGLINAAFRISHRINKLNFE